MRQVRPIADDAPPMQAMRAMQVLGPGMLRYNPETKRPRGLSQQANRLGESSGAGGARGVDYKRAEGEAKASVADSGYAFEPCAEI